MDVTIGFIAPSNENLEICLDLGTQARNGLGRAGHVHVDAVVRLVEAVVRHDIVVDRARMRDLHQSPLGIISVIDRLGCTGHAGRHCRERYRTGADSQRRS